MINRLISLLAAAILVTGCSNNDTFTIKGVIGGEKKKMIYLSRVDINTPVLIDSAKISSGGSFRFRVKADVAEFYQLGYSDTDFITLLAEPGEKIELAFTGSTLFADYRISGSEGSEKVRYLDETLARTRKSLDSLSTVYREASAKPDFSLTAPVLEEKYNALVKEQRARTIDFIIKNTKSLASLKAVYQKISPETYVLYDPRDLQFLKILSDSLKAAYPSSKQVQALQSDFDKELNQMYANRLSELVKDLPATKLDPVLPDVNGRKVALSSLKGKYVLLTFWSVRSAECVNENLKLKELYRQYSKKGFEIYQVNLDINPEEWKKAVSFDELPWISTREEDPLKPKYANLFNVRTLPANYLFDRDGDLIGSNLHDRALAIKLEQLFK